MINKVALIPARSGSERVKNKNLREVKGHPLIAYTISVAIECDIFTQVVVSTDSEEIAEISSKYGASVPYIRPTKFAKSESPDFDWVNLAINEWLELNDEDLFSILRPTNPIRKASTIVRALEAFELNSNFDSLRAIRPVREHPGKMWRFNNNNQITPFDASIESTSGAPSHSSPLQTLEPLWVQDASLEIAYVRTVRKTNSISGNVVMGFVMPDKEGFDLNYEEDFEFLEYLIQSGKVELNQVD